MAKTPKTQPATPQRLETVWKSGADGTPYPTLRPASSNSGSDSKKPAR